jgi:hypothetical protein
VESHGPFLLSLTGDCVYFVLCSMVMVVGSSSLSNLAYVHSTGKSEREIILERNRIQREREEPAVICQYFPRSAKEE